MKRKILLVGILLMTVGIFAGCGNLKTSPISTNTTTKKQSSASRTTWQVTGSMYQSVLQNGKYKTSSLRGLSVNQSENPMDVRNFELGLLNLSMNKFPTKKYIFQEGQQISMSDAQDWIGRKSKSNPDGLNPEDNKKTNPKERNPMYLQQIAEQDYLTQNGNKFTLAGMSLGLGMNSVDYYTTKQYGATLQTNINKDKMESEAKAMANTMLKRVRSKKETAQIPIMIGLYEQNKRDSMVGGNFFAYGISENGSHKIDKWVTVNEQNVSFPQINGEKVPNAGDAEAFTGFKNSVENFFPTLSGITGQAHYTDGTLDNLDITINTQFYSATEIMSFTQFVAGEASKFLPRGASIEITIKSVNQVEAFVARNSGDDGFYSHMFTAQN